MSNSNKEFKTTIQTLLAIGNEQLIAAKNEDWETVEKKEEERQTLLRNCFKNPPKQELHDLVRLAISKIREQERQLITLTENARLLTREKLQKLQKGNKVKKAYQQDF